MKTPAVPNSKYPLARPAKKLLYIHTHVYALLHKNPPRKHIMCMRDRLTRLSNQDSFSLGLAYVGVCTAYAAPRRRCAVDVHCALQHPKEAKKDTGPRA